MQGEAKKSNVIEGFLTRLSFLPPLLTIAGLAASTFFPETYEAQKLLFDSSTVLSIANIASSLIDTGMVVMNMVRERKKPNSNLFQNPKFALEMIGASIGVLGIAISQRMMRNALNNMYPPYYPSDMLIT